jgi:uncharacterized membrane-anchored protein
MAVRDQDLAVRLPTAAILIVPLAAVVVVVVVVVCSELRDPARTRRTQRQRHRLSAQTGLRRVR